MMVPTLTLQLWTDGGGAAPSAASSVAAVSTIDVQLQVLKVLASADRLAALSEEPHSRAPPVRGRDCDALISHLVVARRRPAATMCELGDLPALARTSVKTC